MMYGDAGLEKNPRFAGGLLEPGATETEEGDGDVGVDMGVGVDGLRMGEVDGRGDSLCRSTLGSRDIQNDDRNTVVARRAGLL